MPQQQPGTVPPPVPRPPQAVSPKSRTIATLLAFFLGVFGAHRFYLGHTTIAIIQLILGIVGIATSWLIVGLIPLAAVGIWALVDFIMLLAGSMKDSAGLPVLNWQA